MTIEMVGSLAKLLKKEGLLDERDYEAMRIEARQDGGEQSVWRKLTELNSKTGEWHSFKKYQPPYRKGKK